MLEDVAVMAEQDWQTWIAAEDESAQSRIDRTSEGFDVNRFEE